MKCLICNSNCILNNVIFYKCNNCNHIYKKINNNLEINSEYHLKYSKNKIKMTKQGINPIFHKQRERIVKERLKIIKSYLNKNYYCLDVGGSAGTFALKIKDYIKQIDITDLASYQKQECEKLGFIFYRGNFIELNFNKKYDIITAWHVLEHIDNIHSFILKIKQLSKKYIFIEIPYNRKINPKVIDGHVQYFNKYSFNLFLKQYFNNFKIIEGIQKPSLLAIITI